MSGNNSLTGNSWQDMFDFSGPATAGLNIDARNNYWTGGSSAGRYGTNDVSNTIIVIPEHPGPDPNP